MNKNNDLREGLNMARRRKLSPITYEAARLCREAHAKLLKTLAEEGKTFEEYIGEIKEQTDKTRVKREAEAEQVRRRSATQAKKIIEEGNYEKASRLMDELIVDDLNKKMSANRTDEEFLREYLEEHYKWYQKEFDINRKRRYEYG